MSAQVTCPKCGTLRPHSAVQGLCPQCLGKLVLGNDEDDLASPWDDSADFQPDNGPRLFGDYEIIEQIGIGGMGIIFKARQIPLNRIVALKMIRGQCLTRKADILRFRAEAEAAAHLQHPGIVAIHEIGEVEGQHFYSMDLVEGQNLAQKIEPGPLPPDKAAQYIREVARAMHYAHTRGIIHRDLKPSNVLVDASDHPRVTDFGLAKVLQSDSGLTLSGTVIGSPSYMSPEQAQGRSGDVGVQSDVYALGAILYALLIGRPPFEGDTTAEILRKVEDVEPERPRSVNPRLPRDLETICLKCLDKAPTKRYSSAEHLAEELDRFLAGEPIHARPIAAPERLLRWCKRKPLGAAALLAVVVGMAGVFWQWREAEFERQRGQERLLRLNLSSGLRHLQQNDLVAALPWLAEALALETPGQPGEQNARIRIGSVLDRAPRLLQLWVEEEMLTWAEFSPDGKLVALASQDGTARVYDCATGELAAPPLQHGHPIFILAFSPDGRRLLSTGVDQTVQLWDVKTGRAIGARLRHGAVNNPDFTHAAFSPDARVIATTAADKTTRLWDAEMGRPLITEVKHAARGMWVAFHPDGSRFACAAGHEISVRSATNGEALLPPMRHSNDVFHINYSPDGRRLVSGGRDFTARIWDAQTGAQIGSPLKHTMSVKWVEFSRDGRMVATASYDRTARVWDAETGVPLTPWLRHVHSVVQITFSPDGRRVLTTSHDHNAQIWDIATGEPALTFKHNGFVTHTRFSPDGHQVLTAGQDNVARLWNIAVDMPLVKPLADGTNGINAVAFSPAGDKFASGSQDRTARIWETSTGRELLKLAHDASVGNVVFNRDGTLLATTAGRDALVWRIGDGSNAVPPLEHSASVLSVAFSPDGSRIATGTRNGIVQLWNIGTGKPSAPPLLHPGSVKSLAFSPDGRKLATSGTNFVRLWTAAGDPLCDWIKHDAEVRYVAFSPDNTMVATVCSDAYDPHMYPRRYGRVWEAGTGKPLTPPLQHSDGVLFCTFTRDSKRVITTSEDGTAQIWDVRTGTMLAVPLRHDSHVYGAQVTPDGSRVLTWGRDGTVRMWDMFTGDAVIPPIRAGGQVARAALSPDGSRVVVGSDQGELRLWNVVRDDRPVSELTSLAALLTGQRLDPLSGPAALESRELKQVWETFRRKYPQAFKADGARVLSSQ